MDNCLRRPFKTRPNYLTAIALIVILVSSSGRDATADDLPAIAKDRPILLHLNVAGTPVEEAREARFAMELEMLIDGIDVLALVPEATEFADSSLKSQVNIVRQLVGSVGAIAAVWIVETENDMVMLHLVVVSTGRALVRLIETRKNPGFETDLAIAARELLGTAYLFDQAKAREHEVVTKVVNDIKTIVAPPKPPKSTSGDHDPTWAAAVSFVSQGGIWGNIGPSIMLGGRIHLDRTHAAGFSTRVGVGWSAGPIGDIRPGLTIKQRTGEISIGAVYRWTIGEFETGPKLAAEALLSKVTVIDRPDIEETMEHWRLRFCAGQDLVFPVSRRFRVVAGGGVCFSPVKDSYTDAATSESVYSTPTVGWRASLGLSWAGR